MENVGDKITSGVMDLARRANALPFFGQNARVKPFFRDREADGPDDIPVYTELPPLALPNPRQNKINHDAILAFMDKEPVPLLGFESAPSLQVTHIKIQSPFLRKELRALLEPYHVEYDDDCPVLYRPFKELFFVRDELFRRQRQHTEGTDERKHIDILIDTILNSGEVSNTISEAADLEQDYKIDWKHVWTLFPADSIVVAKTPEGHEQAYQVLEARQSINGQSLNVKCQYVHFDGHRFGHFERSIEIRPFLGSKFINELPVYPLRLARRGDASHGENLRKTFKHRGLKMLDYQDVHHIQVRPATLDTQRENYDELMKYLSLENSHGRAMVDFYTAAKRNSQWRRSVRPLYDHGWPPKGMPVDRKGKGPELYAAESDNDAAIEDDDFQPATMAPVVADSASRPDAQAQEENRNYVKIEDLNLVLMSPLLHAFSFESKKWIAINVDFVSPVQFDGSINRHLVADEEDKEMLHSLVARHSRVAQGLEDPILQKGKGLVVLLSGPPGTGKTLMAEAIAEKAKRPLYCVDTRDLGSEYKSISKYFQRIMENAAEWNAIVLLDEAEMFLQRRNTKARDSNEKVTAFLRCLEHVQGILFMTTNFPEALDVAVESRIHIHITVDRPSLNKRKRIWDHFLEKLPSLGRNHTLSDADRVTLASWAINGRQIKNSFRMSLSVRESKTEPITLRDLERMIRMSCPVAKKEGESRSGGSSGGDDLLMLDEKPAVTMSKVERGSSEKPRGFEPKKAAIDDLISLDFPTSAPPAGQWTTANQMLPLLPTTALSQLLVPQAPKSHKSSSSVDDLLGLGWPPEESSGLMAPMKPAATPLSLQERFSKLGGPRKGGALPQSPSFSLGTQDSPKVQESEAQQRPPLIQSSGISLKVDSSIGLDEYEGDLIDPSSPIKARREPTPIQEPPLWRHQSNLSKSTLSSSARSLTPSTWDETPEAESPAGDQLSPSTPRTPGKTPPPVKAKPKNLRSPSVAKAHSPSPSF